MYEPSIIVTLRCAFPRASTPQLPPGAGTQQRLSIPMGAASPQQPQVEAELGDLHFSHPILALPKHLTQRKWDEHKWGQEGGKSYSVPIACPAGEVWWPSGVLGATVVLSGHAHAVISKVPSARVFSCC